MKFYLESNGRRFLCSATSAKEACLHWMTVTVGRLDHLDDHKQWEKIDERLKNFGRTILVRRHGWIERDLRPSKLILTSAIIAQWAERRRV